MIIYYFLLGLLLSFTPGPVVLETIQMGLKRDKRIKQFVFGTFIGVGVIAFITLFGANVNLFEIYPVLRKLIIVVNTTVLLYIGWLALKTNKRQINKKRRQHHEHPVVNGILMSITSPSRWVVWISTAVIIRQSTIDLNEVLLYGLVFALGSFSFFIALSFLVMDFGVLLKHNTLIKVSRFAGIAIIGFAFYGFLGIFI